MHRDCARSEKQGTPWTHNTSSRARTVVRYITCKASETVAHCKASGMFQNLEWLKYELQKFTTRLFHCAERISSQKRCVLNAVELPSHENTCRHPWKRSLHENTSRHPWKCSTCVLISPSLSIHMSCRSNFPPHCCQSFPRTIAPEGELCPCWRPRVEHF